LEADVADASEDVREGEVLCNVELMDNEITPRELEDDTLWILLPIVDEALPGADVVVGL
jgi:hypothetical protein